MTVQLSIIVRNFSVKLSMIILNYLFRRNKIFCIIHSRFASSVKMKVLNVAEKNDAAKTLAGFMSSNIRRREGFSKYNKIYEFESMVLGQKCDMIMTSVSGHLLGLEFSGFFRSWKSCNPLALFDAPIAKNCISGYEDIKRTLEREIKKCSVLIIWTDCDREGESIGFEIIEVCKAVKSNIRIYRAKFSEITFQSVKRALQNLSEPDKRINDAVLVRQELDLRIGAAFTRFQTLRLGQVFPQTLNRSLVSYGSCQFPTLGFVVERYKAIENFIPENFWKIRVIHEANDLSVEFSWNRGRLFDENVCRLFYEMCMENPVATVLSVSSKPKSKWRPLPLDTIELEKVASRKLKINAKEVMRIAERLYTQGFISYPRTETNIFPKELDLNNLIGIQTADQDWGVFASRILQDGPNPRNGNKSDKAHPPIHPIKYTNNLGGDEKKVYEFVVRRFLACCSKDALGQETVVEISISDEKFVANGLMILERNYLEVYPYEKWNAKEIHIYQMGQSFSPVIEMTDGTTSPPKYLTEADLIALMEKHGIGTDATHADHIETIKSRLYVGLENEKFFVPGQLGMGLVEGYDSMGYPMSKPNLRAELEADLVKICEGRKAPDVVLREQIQKYKEVFEVALQQASKIDEALALYLQEQPQQIANESIETPAVVLPCPMCGSQMVLRTRKDSSQKFISCLGFPNCKNAVWFPSGVESVEATEDSCPECGPNVKKLKFQFQRGFLPVYLTAEESLCIGGCNEDFLECLNVSLNKVRGNPPRTSSLTSSSSSFLSTQSSILPTSTNSGSGRGSGGGSGRGNGRGSSRGSGGASAQGIGRGSGRGSGPGNGRGSGRGSGHGSGRGHGSDNGGGSGRGSGLGRGSGVDSGSSFGRGSGSGRGTREPLAGQRSILDSFSRAAVSDDPPTFSHPGRSTIDVPQQNSENFLVCNCSQTALLLTVRKEGPNKGRQFYKCGNDGQCDFFQWGDSLPSGQSHPPSNVNSWNSSDSGFQGSRNTNNSTAYNNPSSGGFGMVSSNFSHDGTNINHDDETHPVVCRCNNNALLLTVKKEGPNKGRQFYKCQGSSCDFFLWADAPADSAQQQNTSYTNRSNSNSWQPPTSRPLAGTSWGNTASGGSDGTEVFCVCGGPARRLTVQKEGPNKGRQFYGCPKSTDRCNFFSWADEGNNSFGSSSSSWQQSGSGTSRGRANPSGTGTKRKCSNCGEEGHTKRTCNNR